MSSRGGGTDKSAKHVLDEFGQKVHEEIVGKKADGTAKKYIDDLKGSLSQVSINSELVSSPDPCKLDYTKHTTSANGNTEPCEKDGNVERFSVKQQAEYDNKKMRSGGKGACAPYRRLSLCNKNMEKIPTSSTKHDLLVDVCMAAQFEGESIKTHYKQYEVQYPGSGSTICTVLARSFADIGDIVRGKDLYGGNKKKERLEDNLKKIFRNIYDKLLEDNMTNGKKGEIETRYKDGKDPKGDFFQLREDWWTANRETVWEAMTCKAEGAYFHATCSDGRGGAQANHQCRCDKEKAIKAGDNVSIVPTYFDYVPQYLRWFEEWAEDFCRKKNKKIKDVQKQCRDKGEDSDDRYCSRNGFDCEKTKRAIGKLRYGKGCTDCFFACHRYENWIEKQKEQFDKQKQRYDNVINGTVGSGSGRQRRGARNENYDGYEKIFYKKLKGEYSDVNDFLGLLNEEKACKEVQDDKEGKIDFKNVNSGSGSGGDASGDSSASGASSTSDTSGTNDKTKGTFYRSDYCQPCPICGVKKTNNATTGKKWEEKDKSGQCKNIKLYKPKNEEVGTSIKILKSGEGEKEIKEKLEAFCNQTNGVTTNSGDCGGTNSDSSLCDPWKCYEIDELTKEGQEGVDDVDDHYYDELVKTGGGLCILKKEEQSEKKIESEANSQNNHADIQKTFHDFFYYWVAHMLKDSIHWRTKKIKKCLEKKNGNRCRNECKTDCGCFKRWIDKKKTEWDKIKEQFSKQDFGSKGALLGVFGSGYVLQENLKEEFLKGDSTEDKQNSLDAEEIQHLREMLKETGAIAGGGSSSGGVTEQKNIMDKLIEYEKKIATECQKDCKEPSPKPSSASDLGRSETHDTPASEADDDDEDEEDDKDLDGHQDTTEDTVEDTVEDGGSSTTETQPEEAPPATDTSVNVCETVEEVLGGKLDDACKQKYGHPQRHWGWKCISDKTGTDEARAGPSRREAPSSPSGSSEKGSICVPPRRRKLYIKKIQDWAKEQSQSLETGETSSAGGKVSSQESGPAEGTSESSGSEASPQSGKESSQSGEKLRDAFIESAAVETFFLWDKYKMEKKKEKEEKKKTYEQIYESGGEDEANKNKDPQTELNDGTIPNDFLRLMFYTLADYKDILYSGSNTSDNKGTSNSNDIKNIVLEASGNKEDMEKIQKKIKEILPTSGNKENSVPPNSGQKTTRESWWDKNAKYIWNGMVCALTYKENSSGGEGKTIEKVKTADGKDLFDELKKKYGVYESVELENSETEAKKATEDPASGEKTTLDSFVKRPPYFRYLEEWGQNFCKERLKRLEKIKGDCYKDRGATKQYSGDGEDCDKVHEDPTIVRDLEGRSCAISCRSYKKWIERKKDEYDKQKSAYTEQKKKYENGNNKGGGGNGFCGTLGTYDTAAKFLKTLGPCKPNNGEGKTIFDENGDTFQHTNLCDPCSKFKVKCENGKCTSGGTKSKCDGNNRGTTTITAEKIGNGVDSTVLDMRVSDNSKSGFEDGLGDCKSSGIFTGIIEKKWECGNFCGYVVCKPKKVDGKENEKHIIQIRALLKRWVEYFLEDYNKINSKISHCMKKSDRSKCISGCEEKCKCVEQWIEKKKEEWPKIRDHYLKPYQNADGNDMKSLVRHFMETLIPQMNLVNDKKKIKDLPAFLKLYGCNCADNSQNSTQNDVVLCLLENLKTKATSCQTQHQPSGIPETECQNPTTLPDQEDLLLEETEENQVENQKVGNKAPAFCEIQEKKEEEESGCEPENEKKKDEKKEESAAIDPVEAEEKEEKVPPAPAPAAPPSTPLAPSDEPSKPISDILSSTIPFGIAIALTSIVFLFLKKKTKSSVGNLFQILQIPKSDYDIPTLKSSNRYIPYVSDRHKGKTYIYMEGDSDEDKYMFLSDTTDITSSESEYEELDINDIYVPGSPKYKTLIEVVLEPSKRDTQNDIHNDIPSDIPNTPSDTPPPITDDEWNQLKKDFISNMLQNTQNTEPNILHDNVDNNTHPTMSRHKVDQKPFIMSIHDRNLYIGEEYSYDMSTNSGQNNVYSGIDPTSANHDSYSDKNDPISDNHHPYSGIDLINDVLNGDYDIYDEILKRKENELFGTYHTKKNTSTNSVAKNTNSDPILNQINLFHKWLDRHRYMCAKLKNKEDILNKLKEEWNKENNNNSGKTYNSDNKPSHNHVLNTDVSIQIDMDNPKTKNEFKNMDTTPDKSTMNTMLDDLEKYNEPYYYDFYKDDIYYDVNDDDKASVDHNKMDNNNSDVPTKVQIEMNVINNQELLQNEYPISHM
ncbi:hypothetical protein PFMALIP_05683 [Plasmodium falciparum MaliPS096_E11]|uniref:Erythrocyte membrane protein 1 n=1 Tax=Plasmodium falciparum MaliPS096_E11 TaxID=1036727 RepID=A0A024WI79_PLAFA|nr:hypothetical protein PFMALIP_05683 [Plasmodium falciparum MaliPS096_E11]